MEKIKLLTEEEMMALDEASITFPRLIHRLLALIEARDRQIAALIKHCNMRHGCDIGEDPDYGF